MGSSAIPEEEEEEGRAGGGWGMLWGRRHTDSAVSKADLLGSLPVSEVLGIN